MKNEFFFVSVFGILCILNTPALAVTNTFTMTGNDAGNTSSFNNAGLWLPAGAPVAATPPDVNSYVTVGYLLRSPVVGGVYQTGNWTFAGDVLTVGGGNGGGLNPFPDGGFANNNAFIFKATPLNITVNNLILDAGNIRDGLGGGQSCSMNGNIYVTANGGGFLAQCLVSINSAISGPGPIYIGQNGNGYPDRVIYFTSRLSTYSGNIQMLGGSSQNNSRLTFTAGSIMNFLIGANGVNNSISGIGIPEFDGNFNINLTGASTNMGDSWTLVSATGKTFVDATFAVNGFTSLGGGLWQETAPNGATYQFSESTATLTVVPEPATWIMLALGAMGIALYSRKK